MRRSREKSAESAEKPTFHACRTDRQQQPSSNFPYKPPVSEDKSSHYNISEVKTSHYKSPFNSPFDKGGTVGFSPTFIPPEADFVHMKRTQLHSSLIHATSLWQTAPTPFSGRSSPYLPDFQL